MRVWGISANSHDAALAVFDKKVNSSDGYPLKLLFASHAERFSGVKNDAHLNAALIDYARDNYGAPDEIVWYERPFKKSLRQLRAGQGWNFRENNISRYLASYGLDAPIRYVDHHLSHAAAGYYTSKFDDASILCIDAIGEFETLTIWTATRNSGLKKVFSQSYPHSIGLWYSAMTQRCGLKPNEEEYILMGMAALGDPKRFYNDILEDFVLLDRDGPRVRFKQNLHRGCMDWKPAIRSQQDIYDLAASTQRVYEFLLRHVAMWVKDNLPSKNLVLMGGCALNCSANSLLAPMFDDIWIMPNPGDAGSAVGAVVAHYKQFIKWPGAYLGYDMGSRDSNASIVDHLLEHKFCGLARGPAEFGPRALGNRSLIADPRGPEIKALINTIKHREQFRPFAPAILEEFANSVFKMPIKSTPYMQFIAPCTEYGSYPAIVHYDNTSRVQTVPKDGSPFRLLLEEWYARTGCPMLLNTSLNIKGKPMVNTHQDADDWEAKYGVKIFR